MIEVSTKQFSTPQQSLIRRIINIHGNQKAPLDTSSATMPLVDAPKGAYVDYPAVQIVGVRKFLAEQGMTNFDRSNRQ